MTDEEIEKEAEFVTKGWKEQKNCIQAYLAGAKPREKRIAELEGLLINSKRLSDTIEKAQKKQIAELEAQIEKMKCCENCQTVRDAEGNCYLLKDGKCKNKDKWELRR